MYPIPRGSALRDEGCVVRVGQGVLSGASLDRVVCTIYPLYRARDRNERNDVFLSIVAYFPFDLQDSGDSHVNPVPASLLLP
jgi:hypothetical protein